MTSFYSRKKATPTHFSVCFDIYTTLGPMSMESGQWELKPRIMCRTLQSSLLVPFRYRSRVIALILEFLSVQLCLIFKMGLNKKINAPQDYFNHLYFIHNYEEVAGKG